MNSSLIYKAIGILSIATLSLNASTKLNPPLVSGGNVTIHRTSPDASRIIYRADQDVDEVFELYSIPFEGGPSTKISGSMVDGGDVEFLYQILPDSNRVLYFADQDTDDVLELYSTPIDGGAPPIKLNGPLGDGGNVIPFDFEVSSDGTRAVFLAKGERDGHAEVFSTLTNRSGTSVKLNGPLIPDDGEVMDFEISPDSQTVIYRAIQDIQFREELYSRPIDGSGAPVKLNNPLVRGGDVIFLYEIDPTSTHVVFRADQEIDQKLELFSRRIDGSGIVNRINDPLASDESRVGGFRITPDGSHVIYNAEQDLEDTNEIYVRPIDGSGSPLKLSNPLGVGRNAFIDDINEDGNLIVYLADQETQDVVEAYSVPVDGRRPAQRVNGPLVEEGRVIGGALSLDSKHFIFFADAETANTVEVFSSPIDGGEMVKLNGPLSQSDSASAFGISRDSLFVVYLEGNIFFGTGIFAVPIGGGKAVRLDQVLEGGNIEGLLEIASDNRTVVYRAIQDTPGVLELYSARIPYGECDFNESGNLDVGDLDLLMSEIRNNENFFPFDVTGDFLVNLDDLLEFVSSPDKLNTFIGDANLDGEFNSGDLVDIFQVGEYEDAIQDNSTWAEGDWNADGDFGTGDLVFAFQIGGYERGPRVAVAIPEPNGIPMIFCIFCFWFPILKR